MYINRKKKRKNRKQKKKKKRDNEKNLTCIGIALKCILLIYKQARRKRKNKTNEMK